MCHARRWTRASAATGSSFASSSGTPATTIQLMRLSGRMSRARSSAIATGASTTSAIPATRASTGPVTPPGATTFHNTRNQAAAK
ncbi:hypothetical protein WY02_15825 [Pseudonocardia sp. AL041005-10]|nr:hypothetical protein WY02_15825 [Pseudonocardia sp. AL041005-10]